MFGFQRVTPTAPSYIRFRPCSEVLIACCHLPVGVCIYQVQWIRWAMMSWAGSEVDFICGIQLDFNVGWRPGYTSKNFFGRGSKQYQTGPTNWLLWFCLCFLCVVCGADNDMDLCLLALHYPSACFWIVISRVLHSLSIHYPNQAELVHL